MAWRILVADDEPQVLQMIQEILTELPASVLAARDGEEALRIAKTERPDLILLDVMMPKLDGFGVAAALKRDAATATIPLIFMSALAAPRDKVRGLDLGAEDYLAKSIGAEPLRTRVREILGRVRPPDQAQGPNQELSPISALEPIPMPELDPTMPPIKDPAPAPAQVPSQPRVPLPTHEPVPRPAPAPTQAAPQPAAQVPIQKEAQAPTQAPLQPLDLAALLPPAQAPVQGPARKPAPDPPVVAAQAPIPMSPAAQTPEPRQPPPEELAQTPPPITGLFASGQLQAMHLESLVQLLESERRPAKLLLARGAERGEIAFVGGAITRAVQGPRQGEAAVHQLLTWREGTFQLHILDAPSQVGGPVTKPNQALLMEGLRRLDELPGLRSGLPDPHVPMEVPAELRAAVQQQAKPDAAALIALLDGTRILEQVLAQSPFDDWTTMRDLSYLLGTRAIPPKHVSPEIRTGPRVILELPIEYQRVPPFQKAPSCNLSARGVFIQTATPYEIGEQVLLRFTLSGQDSPVKVLGQVVWRNTEPGKPGGVGMGVRFLDLRAADRQVIERNLAEAIAAGLSRTQVPRGSA